MQPSRQEIVILNPTPFFLKFLSVQLHNLTLTMNLLQTDCTGYIIKKENTEEKTLDEIERHFSTMFHHEICRWFGNQAYNSIENKFLDFLCCFKLEFHSQLIIMEKFIEDGKQLLEIKPRPLLLSWLRNTVAGNDDLNEIVTKINVNHLAENSTVIIKNFQDLLEIKPFLQENYSLIFNTEMMRMCEDKSLWPVVNSYELFNQYFAVNVHTQLINLPN